MVGISTLDDDGLKKNIVEKQHYDNAFDEDLNFACDLGEHLVGMESIYDGPFRDRAFKLTCINRAYIDVSSCQWKPEDVNEYVNNMDEDMNYSCPGNSIVTGVFSHHEDHYEDRQWRIRCCQVCKHKTVFV